MKRGGAGLQEDDKAFWYCRLTVSGLKSKMINASGCSCILSSFNTRAFVYEKHGRLSTSTVPYPGHTGMPETMAWTVNETNGKRATNQDNRNNLIASLSIECGTGLQFMIEKSCTAASRL